MAEFLSAESREIIEKLNKEYELLNLRDPSNKKGGSRKKR